MNRLWILLRALFVRLEASNMIQFLKHLAILARVKLSRNYSYFSCDFTICKFLLYFVFTRLPEGFSNYLGKINISSIWVFYTKISKSKYAPFLYFHFCSETVRYLSLLILNSAIAFLFSFCTAKSNFEATIFAYKSISYWKCYFDEVETVLLREGKKILNKLAFFFVVVWHIELVCSKRYTPAQIHRDDKLTFSLGSKPLWQL